jgi:BlaI family transcriptional regulator, penicillinase repressor
LEREMANKTIENLSRRERQIMDIIYQKGNATAMDVMDGLPDPPSYSAVRAMLRILEEKGILKHKHNGPRYVFIPRVSRERAKKSAMKNILTTFFEGSPESAMATLLDVSKSDLSEEDFDRLENMIKKAKEEGL